MLLKRTIRILKKHIHNYFLYYAILGIILIIGIVIGPLIINLFNLKSRIAILKIFNPFYRVALLSDYMKYSVIKTSLFSNIFLIVLILLMSIINISIFIVPILVLIKGISIGYTVGFIVNNFGFKGFLLSIGGIYPQNIFILSGLIGLGAISMSTTTNIFRTTLASSKLRYGNSNLNDSLVLGGVYSFIIIFGVIIEGLLSHRFLSLTLDFFI